MDWGKISNKVSFTKNKQKKFSPSNTSALDHSDRWNQEEKQTGIANRVVCSLVKKKKKKDAQKKKKNDS